MKKQITSLLLSVFLISCSTNINTTNIDNLNKEKKSFGIKSVSTIENTDLTYTGDWSLNGNVHQSTGTVNNTDTSLSYTGAWTTYNNGLTTEGNFAYTNNASPVQLANDTNTNINYLNNGWLTYWIYKYNEIYNSNKKTVTYQETDINKIKYIYGNNVQAWSNSMLYWKTFSNINPAYIYSDYQSAKIEIPFSGTNIQIFQYKTGNRGICNIKVYDSNNNVVRDLNIDNYSPTTVLSKTTITGLKNGNYKVLIQRTGNKNLSSTNYLFDFVKAEVLPSIEYTFTNDNINYNALKNNNCGKVAVTIDNNPATTQIIDLYNSSAIFDKVYTKTNLGSGSHTITIDALGEKNNSSSGFRMSVDEFTANPAVKGTFTGTFLNLKLVKLSTYGKVDLYINGVWNKEIDLYSPTSQYIVENISGLTNTSHTFELVSKNTKNPSSTGTRIAFDGYTTNKASYTFTGTGIKYFANKNNNQGLVDVFIDGNKHGTYTLYSASLQSSQEIVNISGLTNGEHTIDIIPAGIKSWGSTGYGVNVDYLKVNNPAVKRVVWKGYNGSNYNIYLKSLDNLNSITVLDNIDNNSNNLAKINIYGNKVIWSKYDQTTNHIYLKNLENNLSPNNLSSDIVNNLHPQISADGSKVVWRGALGYIDHIYIDNLEDSINPYILSTNTTNNFTPQISADGSKVVWRGADGLQVHVYSRNSDASNEPIQLSSTSTLNENPQISADGSKVVWQGSNSTMHIYSRNSDASNEPIQLSSTSTLNENPQISADGSKVVWHGYNGTKYHIYIRNIDGSGSTTQLSTTSSNNFYPQISADGSKVVWAGTINGTGNIFISSYDGNSWSSPTILSTTSTSNSSPKISADGSKVVWSGNDDTFNSHIYIRNSDASDEPTQLSTISTNNSSPQISD